MPSPSMTTVAPPRGSLPLPVTLPVITADCACASPDTALSNTSNAPAQTPRPNVRCLMMVPPILGNEHQSPARLSSGSSLGQASLYCIRPRKSAIPPQGGLSGPGIRRYLGNKLSKPKRSEEHTSELQSLRHLVCRLLLEKKKTHQKTYMHT